VTDYFVTKRVFFRAVRTLKPDITKAKFDEMWKSFVAERDRHYALKSSLRVIDGGKK
jgi:hypothetical protein